MDLDLSELPPLVAVVFLRIGRDHDSLDLARGKRQAAGIQIVAQVERRGRVPHKDKSSNTNEPAKRDHRCDEYKSKRHGWKFQR